LRCFNLDTRENQLLHLNNMVASDSQIQGAAFLEVTALAYHSEEHMLAVGLSDGHIRCFQHLHERRCDIRGCFDLVSISPVRASEPRDFAAVWLTIRCVANLHSEKIQYAREPQMCSSLSSEFEYRSRSCSLTVAVTLGSIFGGMTQNFLEASQTFLPRLFDSESICSEAPLSCLVATSAMNMPRDHTCACPTTCEYACTSNFGDASPCLMTLFTQFLVQFHESLPQQ
jgi:hypothetical protein